MYKYVASLLRNTIALLTGVWDDVLEVVETSPASLLLCLPLSLIIGSFELLSNRVDLTLILSSPFFNLCLPKLEPDSIIN